MRASCIICTDVFDENLSNVACPCGHVFHEACLQKWMDQSSSTGGTCPECRKKVTSRMITKLFFNVLSSDAPNLNYMENEMGTLKASLKAKDIDIGKLKNEKEEIQMYARSAEERADKYHQEVLASKSEIVKLQLVIKNLNKLKSRVNELEKSNSMLHNKLQHFQNVQTVISGTQSDIEDVLQSVPNGPEALKQMATYCSLLKRELSNLSDSKQKLRNEMTCLKKDVTLLNVHNKKHVNEIKELKEQILALERENLGLIKKRRTTPDVTQGFASTSEGVSTNVHLSYESPAPERLVKLDSNDDISVTPVRDRVKIQPLIKVNFGFEPHKKTFNLTNISAPSPNINPFKMNPSPLADDNSIIRNGYNGLGGHSKFITKSSLNKFKPPHKRK